MIVPEEPSVTSRNILQFSRIQLLVDWTRLPSPPPMLAAAVSSVLLTFAPVSPRLAYAESLT